MPGQPAMSALPEVDESKDLLGFFALAQIGVGLAEGVGAGLLGQEDQDTGLAATAHGHGVSLQQGVLAVIRNGVEVQIEGLAWEERFAHRLGVPSGQLAQRFGVVDPGGVFGEETLFGERVQSGKESQTGANQFLEGSGAWA